MPRFQGRYRRLGKGWCDPRRFVGEYDSVEELIDIVLGTKPRKLSNNTKWVGGFDYEFFVEGSDEPVWRGHKKQNDVVVKGVFLDGTGCDVSQLLRSHVTPARRRFRAA